MNPATAPPQPAAPPVLDDPVLRERLHRHAVVRLRPWIPDADDRADDVIQETMMRAVKSFSKFDPAKGDFGGWLHGILNLVLKEERRKHARQAVQPLDPNVWEEVRSALDPNSNLELVNTLLDKISPKNRELIRLRYLVGHSPEEIATRQGITYGAARVQLCRALAQLKDVAGKAGVR